MADAPSKVTAPTEKCITNSLTSKCDRPVEKPDEFHGACCISCYVAPHANSHTTRCNERNKK